MTRLDRTPALLLLGALALLAPAARAEPLAGSVQRERLPSTSSRTRKAKRIAVVSDGWRPGEEAAFFAAARGLARRLLTDSAGPAILSRFHVDLRYVFVPSAEPVSTSRATRSAFGARLVGDVLEYPVAGEQAIAAAVAAWAGRFQPDLTATLTRLAPGEDATAVRAWCQTPWSGKRMSLVDGDLDAFVHELGHGLFGLGDEYGGDHAGPPSSAEKAELRRHFNLVDDPASTAWRIHTAAPLREGGAGYTRGLWHAFEYCRMNQSRSQRFCAVCEQHIEFVRDSQEDPEGQQPHLWLQLLHEPTAATSRTGTSVLLAAHPAPDGLPFGLLHAAPGAPVRLRFNQYGDRPSRWRITIEGHGVRASKELAGSATDVTFSAGFPALVDDPGRNLPKSYIILCTNLDRPDATWGGQKVDSMPIGRLRVR